MFEELCDGVCGADSAMRDFISLTKSCMSFVQLLGAQRHFVCMLAAHVQLACLQEKATDIL